MPEPVLRFGAFELSPAQRQLLEDGRPVRLGSRALDLLIVLARHAGEVLTKDQLFAAVWPGLSVEETNLRVHVSALRRALGDGSGGRRFISSVAGRGYSFVVPVSEGSPLPATGSQRGPNSARVAGSADLPLPLTRMLGREDLVRDVAAQLPRRRLVTLAGPGGIGKTTVALAVADRLSPAVRDGVHFVDLTPVEEPGIVPAAVAAGFGLTLRGEATAQQALGDFLRDKEPLLILDCCEHVLDGTAELVQALLREAPGLLVLATSREPLRTDGEWVQRVEPLSLPPEGTALTASEALTFPSVQLFVERAAAALGGFELDDGTTPQVVEICRRLDGIALAIELAAGRLDAFGLRELAALLDNRFRILTRGRRTVVPRHQTLRATLDWSYGLLAADEQQVLRRLSVFRGGFTLAAARAVAGGSEAGALEFGDTFASLVGKSLVAVEFGGPEPEYRLYETTREYADERLRETGDTRETLRRHAEYHRRLFEGVAASALSAAPADLLKQAIARTDDVRAALRWAFSEAGDAELAVALTIASVPLWHRLSSVDECLAWVRQALDRLDPADAAPAGNRRRMQLHAAAGWVQMYSTTHVDDGAAAWREALRLADMLGDTDYQSRALWALWADRMNRADFREGLRLGERFRAVFAGDSVEGLVGERMAATALHFLGQQPDARRRIENMLRRYSPSRAQADILRFQFDQRMTARMTLGRILWLQGHVDEALRNIEANVRDAVSLGHALSVCNTLVQCACPVALLAGDVDAAERYNALLRSHLEAEGLDLWLSCSEGFEGEILARRGDVRRGISILARTIETLRGANFVQHLTSFQLALARAQADVGLHHDARGTIDDALARGDAAGDAWALSELLRVRAGLMSDDAGAEELLRRALSVAREQTALSWELRSATDLATLWRRLGRQREARDLLAATVGRVAEGAAWPDLIAAQRLLQAIGDV